jgi:3'-5' exoribonuclease
MVQDVFYLSELELRTTKDQRLFMSFKLSDRTGQLPAVKWDASREIYKKLLDAPYVRVRGTVEEYREKLQIAVNNIEKADEGKIDPSEFLPVSPKDLDELWEKTCKILDTAANPALRELIGRFREDKQLMKDFRACPAALGNHHAYLGGLLEHTCAVLVLAVKTAEEYPRLDRDALITGAFLHDIGKVKEYAWRRAIGLSDRGALVGHLIYGSHMLHEKAALVKDFPPALLDVLDHMILSHHGEYEYGSPKLPMVAEALALHHIDNLDAKINGFYGIVDNTPNEEALWTDRTTMFDGRLYRGVVLEQEAQKEKKK